MPPKRNRTARGAPTPSHQHAPKATAPLATPRTRSSLGSGSKAAPRNEYIAPPSAQRARIESTPMAGDTSVAALAHFRRQPRQPSLLHMIQNPDEEFDSSELNLDTTLCPDSSPVFAPHDESTPQPQLRSQIAPPALPTADAEDDLYTVSPRPRHGRKRKSNEISGLEADDSVHIEVARSETPTRRPTSSSSLSAPPSDASQGTSTPRRIDHDPATYADPLSSSPTTSPVSSPAKPSPRKAHKSHAPTTAMLRALLPRRQPRRARPADSSSEDLDSDPEPSPRRRRPAKARNALSEVKGRRNAAPKTSRAKKPAASGKENDGAARGKTYSRRSAVEDAHEDGESGDEADDAQDEGGLSRELAAARDKFRRIDEAELEFESASLGGSGSSPWR